VLASVVVDIETGAKNLIRAVHVRVQRKQTLVEMCASDVQVPCLLAWSLTALPSSNASFTDFKAARDFAYSADATERLSGLCGECVGVAPLELDVLARVYFCSSPQCGWTETRSQLLRESIAGKTCPRCLADNLREDAMQRVIGPVQKLLIAEFSDLARARAWRHSIVSARVAVSSVTNVARLCVGLQDSQPTPHQHLCRYAARSASVADRVVRVGCARQQQRDALVLCCWHGGTHRSVHRTTVTRV
jgi:hypothetical protein